MRPEQFGRFLSTIFDEWVRHDVGTVFVQTFEAALRNWLGMGASGMCVFNETCGTGWPSSTTATSIPATTLSSRTISWATSRSST